MNKLEDNDYYITMDEHDWLEMIDLFHENDIIVCKQLIRDGYDRWPVLIWSGHGHDALDGCRVAYFEKWGGVEHSRDEFLIKAGIIRSIAPTLNLPKFKFA